MRVEDLIVGERYVLGKSGHVGEFVRFDGPDKDLIFKVEEPHCFEVEDDGLVGCWSGAIDNIEPENETV